MVRGRPSGLKAAPHPLRGRPAAGPDPGDLCGPWRQDPRARHKACPRAAHGTPTPAETTGNVNTETVIYRHCCNDPLSPPRKVCP